MSKYVIDDSTLSAIGDAVREKDGTTDKILVSDLATRILAIEGGGTGEGYEPPAEALALTGDCRNKFCLAHWDWFIEDFGNRITTSNITNMSNMFSQSNVKSIPFELNLAETSDISFAFSQCSYLEEVPVIKGNVKAQTGNYSNQFAINNLFQGCERLKEIPDDYFNTFAGDEHWESAKNYTTNRAAMFQDCCSLRKLPNLDKLVNKATAYSCLYYQLCRGCYLLDEIIDIPIITIDTVTSNCFNYTFYNACRLKRITFKTNEDGSPVVVNWKTQVIDLGTYCGYSQNVYSITKYGLTTDTQITDDISYQALKDNKDSWTVDKAYCRFNRDSVIDLFNSLPDTSAYLATAGGTNTIKISKVAGSATDAGSAESLTEEEIAVATAKGWTVTLV